MRHMIVLWGFPLLLPIRVLRATPSFSLSAAGHLQPEMSDLCDDVMPALVRALQAEADAEVVERVAHGLDNCMEHMHEDALAQYLPDVMPPLLGLIAHADARMHDTLLSCISSAAAAGGDGFEPFAGACSACSACCVRVCNFAPPPLRPPCAVDFRLRFPRPCGLECWSILAAAARTRMCIVELYDPCAGGRCGECCC